MPDLVQVQNKKGAVGLSAAYGMGIPLWGQRETVYSVASESIKIKKTSYVRGLSSIFICALKDQNGLIGLNPGIHAAGEE